MRLVEIIRELSGDRYFIMRHGDATFSIPSGTEMYAFAERLADDPAGLKREAQKTVDRAIRYATEWQRHRDAQGLGLDGFALCADYCFNVGPFMSPAHFEEFVTPYLAQITKAYREMGFYVIKHTDGNIMPIIDQLVSTNPHALHSLDPQAGVDIAVVKKLYGDRLCLIGNVNCAMLDTGTPEQIVEAVRYSLQNGMPGGGYIFSTSNCIYTGMPLKSYEMMLEVWKREGIYT
jgi:uroporphyrinogen decarboxylase